MNTQIITVAADGSRASRQAFAWALEEASGRGCGVEVVTAFERLPEQEEAAARNAAERAAHATMGGTEQDAVVRHAHVPSVSLHVVQGEPVDVLVRASAHSTLLVMGSHSVETITHNALGSVTDTLARMSACPVVVIGPAYRVGPADRALQSHHPPLP